MLAQEAKLIGFDGVTSGRNLRLKRFSCESFRLQCHHLVLDNSVTITAQACTSGKSVAVLCQRRQQQSPMAAQGLFSVPGAGETTEVTKFSFSLNIYLQ